MLLQRLVDYANERLQLPPTLYSETVIPYIIELDSEGKPLNTEPVPTADPANPRTKRGLRRLAPQVARAVGIKPLLLADNAEYTFGLGRETSKPERVAQCHAQYMDLLTRCAAATHEPAVDAVLTFLSDDPAAHLQFPDAYDRGGLVTFRVDGTTFPIDLPSVQAFWANEQNPVATADAPARVMQCIICGQERPVLDRLQGKIKGVPGGQTAGTSIISANADAFESYGLEASLIAPTCAECGEKFTKAANELLADSQSRIIMGGAAFIFWTREPTGFSLLDYFNNPDPATVRLLFDAVRSGKQVSAIDDTAFYASSLSGSGGRAVVRDWIDTTVGEVQRQLARWFEWQRIVDNAGEDAPPLGLYALAAATVRDARKDLAPPTPRALLHAALTGSPVPWSLLAQAVRRNQAEQRVTRPRAALIKLVLASQGKIEEGTMAQLELDNSSTAYHCGRLLAVLENAQDAAIPGIKAGIGDRYYGTASSAPASVFPQLLKGAKNHLSKLQRDRPGAHYRIVAQLDEVTSHLTVRLDEMTGRLTGLPRTLTLEEQGLFSLGYFHQSAANRASIREASERRRAGAAAAAETDDDSQQ
jgi:CRISPR-associated protein Csd1